MPGDRLWRLARVHDNGNLHPLFLNVTPDLCLFALCRYQFPGYGGLGTAPLGPPAQMPPAGLGLAGLGSMLGGAAAAALPPSLREAEMARALAQVGRNCQAVSALHVPVAHSVYQAKM